MTPKNQTRSRTKSPELMLAEALNRVKVTNHLDDASVAHLFPLAEQAIGVLAKPEVVQRVSRRNADSVWLFSRVDGDRPEGFQAFLLLNAVGREQLLSGNLDLFDPPDECLVGQAESPALIYVWATYTPGRLAAGIKIMIDHFTSPRYADVDMVSWAAGVRGERAMLRSGFVKGLKLDGIDRPDLFLMARSGHGMNEPRPRYDTYDPVDQRTGITVVHDINDLLKVAAVRSAVFLGEQNCPFEEEFDGNDFAATHLLAYQDGEPVGCLRARFFRDGAKLERLAVRREYRVSKTAFKLVRAGVDLCRTKGYGKIYGHARSDYLRFWKSFGFDLEEGTGEFAFSDQKFIEISAEFEPTNDAIRLTDGPYRLIRPEGRWDRPGILEESAKRSAV